MKELTITQITGFKETDVICKNKTPHKIRVTKAYNITLGDKEVKAIFCETHLNYTVINSEKKPLTDLERLMLSATDPL